jgi:peroxiredoxin
MRSIPVVLALAAISCASSAPDAKTAGPGPSSPPSSDTESSDITDFTLTDIDGNQVSLSQYVGKGPIVISFWATWCKPCVAEMPHLQRMYDARKKDGFVVLAVSLDGPDTEAEVAPFVRKKGFTFPVLIDSETRAASLYNPRRAAPYTVVIDRHGKILKRREGFNPGDEAQLEADVDAASK